MLKEAIVKRNLTSQDPAAQGEDHFVDKHKIKDVTSNMLLPDNGITNASSKVKTYLRKKYRMGNNETDSINKYDENVYLNNKLTNAHKKKLKLRHILNKDGILDTDINAKNNKDAIKHYRSIMGKKNHNINIVKEEDEFKIGDYIHMGLKTKGGAGFRGHVKAIDETTGEVQIELPKEMHNTFPKIIKGHKSKCFKEEQIDETGSAKYFNKLKKKSAISKMGVDDLGYSNIKPGRENSTFIKGLKKGRALVKKESEEITELSKKTLVDYINKVRLTPNGKTEKNVKLAYKKIDKKKEFDESVELQEISKRLATNYVMKSVDDVQKKSRNNTVYNSKLYKRKKGIKNALSKIGGRGTIFHDHERTVKTLKVPATEGVENNSTIDEISKNILQTYVKKAQQDTTSFYASVHDFSEEKAYADRKTSNRLKGINKAKDKMGKPHVKQDDFPKYQGTRARFTKEEVQLDEISKSLATRYINKAAPQVSDASTESLNARKKDIINNPDMTKSDVGPLQQNVKNQTNKIVGKRLRGLKAATNILTKEELIGFKNLNKEILKEDYKLSTEFHVCTKDGACKGKYANIKRARTALDKHDNNYGSYHHHIKYFNKETKQYVPIGES